ncbi:hypothetical protein HHI36_013134, partial [Cryptolaemus montrouzieri]
SYISRGASITTELDEETRTERRTHIRLSIQPSRIECDFYRNLQKYSGLSLSKRAKIPRMKQSKQMLECVQKIGKNNGAIRLRSHVNERSCRLRVRWGGHSLRRSQYKDRRDPTHSSSRTDTTVENEAEKKD